MTPPLAPIAAGPHSAHLLLQKSARIDLPMAAAELLAAEFVAAAAAAAEFVAVDSAIAAAAEIVVVVVAAVDCAHGGSTAVAPSTCFDHPQSVLQR